MKEHVRAFSLRLNVPAEALPLDTGSKPFSCWKCARYFSRPDSLARHMKRDAHTKGSSDTASGATHKISDPGASINAEEKLINYSDQDLDGAIDTRTAEHRSHPSGDTISSHGAVNDSNPREVGNDPFSQLTWPDSEGFMQFLLSTDSTAWQPPLEVGPSQSFIMNTQQASDAQPVSPWLTADAAAGGVHGGNYAVRDLGNIITTLVGLD